MLTLRGKSQRHWTVLLKRNTFPTMQMVSGTGCVAGCSLTTRPRHQVRTDEHLFTPEYTLALSCSPRGSGLIRIRLSGTSACTLGPRRTSPRGQEEGEKITWRGVYYYSQPSDTKYVGLFSSRHQTCPVLSNPLLQLLTPTAVQ